MARLTVRPDVAKTWLKALPKPANSLDPRDKVPMVAGQQLAVLDNNIFDNGDGHFKLVFSPPLTIGYKGEKVLWKEGYVYGSHWLGISATYKAKTEAATRFSAAGSSIVLQPTPLFVQNDNAAYGRFYGGNLCGQTSLAMLLATIWPNDKVKQLAANAEGGQFENWLGTIFQKIGAESTVMEGQVAVLKELGIKAKATRSASIADLKQALHGHPVVIGCGYKSSGHFVCASGVADKPGDLPDKWPVGKVDKLVAYPQDIEQAGVIINCPYGMRDWSGSGNNWVNIARGMYDTYGLHNVMTTSTLNRYWVDGGEESGWGVFLDPSTPNAGNRAEKPIELPVVSKTITDSDIDRVAKMLGCEARALKAVIEIEANGGGFLSDGRPKILFEAHYFSDFTNHKYDQSHPDISSRKWNRDLYVGGAGEWERFEKTAKLDRRYAICSCSWGLGQVMGSHVIENPEFIDYYDADTERFYKAMCASEGEQLTAMGLFIKSTPQALAGIRSKDWKAFARSYNGDGYLQNAYDVKLAKAYNSLG
jgi:hypothetical protein